MRYSVIIPVYNRPDEVDRIVAKPHKAAFKDFEVIKWRSVGSSVPCLAVICRKVQAFDPVKYYREI